MDIEYGAKDLNRLLARARKRALELEEPFAEAVAPVLLRAGERAARAFKQRATDHLAAAAFRRDALVAAAPSPDSTMVALYPRPEEAAALAVDGGEEPGILHVTLAYLGATDEEQVAAALDALRKLAGSFAPLEGHVGGLGSFGAEEHDDGTLRGPSILLPDVPGLVELRVAVTEALLYAGIDYARDHGFCAHITLGYTEEATLPPEDRIGMPLHFDELVVARGDVPTALPLIGAPALTAAGEPPPWGAPAPGDLVDVDRLTREIRAKTDPIRESVAETMGDAAFPPVSAADGFKGGTIEVMKQMPEEAFEHLGERGGLEGTPWAHFEDSYNEFYPRLEAEIGAADWSAAGVSAQSEAYEAITYAGRDRVLVLRDADGSLAGVVGYNPRGSEVGINHLASTGKAKGVGTRMMAEVSKDAARVGKGIGLDSLPDSEGFYKRLGMRQEGSDFHWSKAQVNGFLDPTCGGSITAAGKGKACSLVRSFGMSFDVTNPFTAKVLQQSARQITEIAQTTQLDVMRVISAAYEEGLSIPQTAARIAEKMAEATPARATLIARTELAGVVNGGSLAAAEIVSEVTGLVLYKEWLTAPGARFPRHELDPSLDGQTVPLDDYFNVGGYELEYPGDPAGPPEEVCNCFPAETLVIAANAHAGFRRHYDGPLVHVETNAHHALAGTPNHPVLADTGWKRLGDLREGDRLVCAALREDEARGAPHVEHVPAPIEQVFRALARRGMTRRIAGRAVQFHGDGVPDHEVEVVAANGGLLERGDSALGEPALQRHLVRAGEPAALLAPASLRLNLGFAHGAVPARLVGGSREAPPLLVARVLHAHEHRSRSAAWLDSEFEQPASDHGAIDAVQLGKRLLGDAFAVSLTEVVKVEHVPFHGAVFNLETEAGAYIANGIIGHNCRCAVAYTEEPPDTGDAITSESDDVLGEALDEQDFEMPDVGVPTEAGALERDIEQIRGEAEWISPAEARARADALSPNGYHDRYNPAPRGPEVEVDTGLGKMIRREQPVPQYLREQTDAAFKAGRRLEREIQVPKHVRGKLDDAKAALRHAEQEFTASPGSLADRVRHAKSTAPLKEAVAKAESEFALAYREQALKALQRVRPMGPTQVATLRSRQALVKEAQNYLPTEWIAQASPRTITTKWGSRGSHVSFGRDSSEITLAKVRGRVLSDAEGSTVALHEIGHEIETVRESVVALENSFYQWRTRGRTFDGSQEKLGQLRDLKPGSGYPDGEVGREDFFSDPYMGRDYGGGNFEILSMGLEGIFTGRHALDPEYRQFILGLLALG